MSSYLPYNFDFSPRADVFVPDFNFYTNVLGVATQKYNAAVQQAGQLLGKYFLADLTNQENIKYRQGYYDSIKEQISSIAATDLSDPVNFSRLRTLVEDISHDEDIVKDMNFTTSYQRNKSFLESLRFNAPDIALKDGVLDGHNYLTYDKNMADLLEYERLEFASQKRGEMKAMQASKVFGLDYVRMANDYLKSLGVKVETIEFLGPMVEDQPSFIVKTNLGELADYNVSNALNRFLQNNQLVKEYFTNQAKHDIYRFEYVNKKDTTQTGVDLLNRLNQHRLTTYDLIKTSVDKSNLIKEEKERIKTQLEALLAGGSLDGVVKAQELVNRYNQLDKNDQEISKTKNETDAMTSYIDELTKIANAEIAQNKALSVETYNKIKMAYTSVLPTLRINEESFKIGYDWVSTHVDKEVKENSLARAHIFGRYNVAAAAVGANKTDSSFLSPPTKDSVSGQEISYFYNTAKENLTEEGLLSKMYASTKTNYPNSIFVKNIDYSNPVAKFSIPEIGKEQINAYENAIQNMNPKATMQELLNSSILKQLGFSREFINKLGTPLNVKNTALSYLQALKKDTSKTNSTHYSERAALINVPGTGAVFVGVNNVVLYPVKQQ